MRSSKMWIQPGQDVGLCIGATLVGEGIICKHTDLGGDDVVVTTNEVVVRLCKVICRQGTPAFGFECGELLRWNKSGLLRLASTGDREEGSRLGISEDVEDQNLQNDGGCANIIIRKDDWSELIVKVIDDNNINFATATVSIINPDVVLQGTRLGDGHVGILIVDFVDGATVEHLRYRDSLVPWPIAKLIAPGGKSLHYHYIHQELERIDASSQKRSYVSKIRPRKKPRLDLSRKEKAISVKDVLMISSNNCCRRKCCQYFDRGLALKIRRRYFNKSFRERKEEEILAIQNALYTSSGERLLGVEGVTICLEAWRILHAKKKTQFDLQKKQVMAGLKIAEHGNRGKKRMSERVSQSLMSMKMIIDESADNHPVKQRTMVDNSRVGLRELPVSLTWEAMRERVNDINISLGLGPISQPTMSFLHQKYFKQVLIHRKGNNFSKCNICSELQHRRARLSGGKEELEIFRRDETEHHEEHTQGRLLYHAWRSHSVAHPKESLCIIHDKMDHFKTALPKMPFCPKECDGVARLPITVTGVLTHGHGPKAIAQYNLACWPADSNASIGSIDSILRMLENPKPMMDSLLEGPDTTNIFNKILWGRNVLLRKDVEEAFHDDTSYLAEKGKSMGKPLTECLRPLPRILRLQLDNAPSDNKNRFVMAYLSLLTARKVFEEVQLGFLMVGHTHEDVDAMFGNFSESLMHNPTWTLPDLMTLFMKARTPHPVPHFVQEVPNFKGFVEPFLPSGSDTLVGHGKPRLFRFYVRADEMPCFQYKLKSNDDVPWLPSEGIEMWCWGNDGRPRLPSGMPKRLPMTEISMLSDVREGIQKYLKFFQVIWDRSETEEIRQSWDHMIKYWKDILETLETEVVQYRVEDGEDLRDGFWPQTKWTDNVPVTFKNVACELDAREYYVGPMKNRPTEAFHPRLDITKGQFILQRPAAEDIDNYPVHLGRVVGDVEEGDLNDENKIEHICLVEWFRPYMGASRVDQQERWKDCWNKKWERDDKNYPQPESISVNSVLWCYKPRVTKSGLVSIPKSVAAKAKDNLDRCKEAEGLTIVRNE